MDENYIDIDIDSTFEYEIDFTIKKTIEDMINQELIEASDYCNKTVLESIYTEKFGKILARLLNAYLLDFDDKKQTILRLSDKRITLKYIFQLCDDNSQTMEFDIRIDYNFYGN
jgi:hypothetical protein